jgi:hypothetical protein
MPVSGPHDFVAESKKWAHRCGRREKLEGIYGDFECEGICDRDEEGSLTRMWHLLNDGRSFGTPIRSIGIRAPSLRYKALPALESHVRQALAFSSTRKKVEREIDKYFVKSFSTTRRA